jgi:starch synthase
MGRKLPRMYRMRIVLAASEVAPFAKTGGLADVAGSLPAALARLGHDVSVFCPYYLQVEKSGARVREVARLFVPLSGGQKEAHIFEAKLPGSGVPVYFVARREFFGRDGLYGPGGYEYLDNLERYAFFCRAICSAARELELAPDVFHLNDWQTALSAAYLKNIYADDAVLSRSAVVFTVHNLGYQGIYPPWKMPVTGLGPEQFNSKELEFYGQINLLKGGLVYADALSTVSKRYAREIQTAQGGYGLDGVLRERRAQLFGIVNGLDHSVWDPATDKLLPARYSVGKMAGKARCHKALRAQMGLTAGSKRPILGMVSRLVEQKGLDILLGAIPAIMDLSVDLVILGSGEHRFEAALMALADRHPGRISVRLGYDEGLAHLIEAGSDVYLMPSRYEPCGLNQMISLRYGTIPVVRETGGLADTVTDGADGFSFAEYDPQALTVAVRRAVSAMSRPAKWRRMIARAMRQDWGWERSASEYVGLYELARSNRGLPPAGEKRREGTKRRSPVKKKPVKRKPTKRSSARRKSPAKKK